MQFYSSTIYGGYIIIHSYKSNLLRFLCVLEIEGWMAILSHNQMGRKILHIEVHTEQKQFIIHFIIKEKHLSHHVWNAALPSLTVFYLHLADLSALEKFINQPVIHLPQLHYVPSTLLGVRESKETLHGTQSKDTSFLESKLRHL